MIQPFELLEEAYVEKLIGLGKDYLVTQSYDRGMQHFGNPQPQPIVVSAYDDLGLAKTHLNAVKMDKYAAIVNLQHPAHKTKMLAMIAGSQYRVYWAVVKSAAELEKHVNLKLKDNMKRYLEQKTNWRISRETTLRPSLQLVFGELFINLKHGSELLRIKLEEIEKI